MNNFNFKKLTLYDENVTTTVSDSTEIIQKQDPIVLAVIEKYKQRSEVGIKKYGTTLAENNHDNFLKHLQEELMDGALYAQKLMSQVEERKVDIEELSAIQHEIWAHWMKYLFSKCTEQEVFENGTHFKTGNLVINKSLVEHWKRQIETPYSELTKKEKQSDRNQVAKFQHLL